MCKIWHIFLPVQYRKGITFIWYLQKFLFIGRNFLIYLTDVLLLSLKSLYTLLKLKLSSAGRTVSAFTIKTMKIKVSMFWRYNFHFWIGTIFNITCRKIDYDSVLLDSHFVTLQLILSVPVWAMLQLNSSSSSVSWYLLKNAISIETVNEPFKLIIKSF